MGLAADVGRRYDVETSEQLEMPCPVLRHRHQPWVPLCLVAVKTRARSSAEPPCRPKQTRIFRPITNPNAGS